MGLTHLGLEVRDLDRSVRFYQEAFGARVTHRSSDSVEINTPGAHDLITLIQSASGKTGNMSGVTHFGFRLASPDDIDAAVEQLTTAGAEISERGEFVRGEPYVFAKDPDGYVIEVWYEKEAAAG